MKVTGSGNIRSGSGTKKTNKAAPTGQFAALLSASGSSEPTSVGATSEVSAPSDLSNLLGLQEISAQDVQRQKLLQQGKNMLDVLEDLRQQLLMGSIPNNTLQQLSRQLSVEKQSIEDPHVMELMDEIELRVAVELAKLEKSRNNNKL